MHTLLLDSVRIRSASLKQLPDDAHRVLVVAVEQILADEISAILVLLDSPVIHIDDNSVLVTNCNGTIQFLCPIRYHNYCV